MANTPTSPAEGSASKHDPFLSTVSEVEPISRSPSLFFLRGLVLRPTICACFWGGEPSPAGSGDPPGRWEDEPSNKADRADMKGAAKLAGSCASTAMRS